MSDAVQLRIACDGSKVGDLSVLDGRVLKGSKNIINKLGKRLGRVVIVQTVWQFVKQEQEFGSFLINGKRYYFNSVTADKVLKEQHKRDF
jgi:hypothetical protein